MTDYLIRGVLEDQKIRIAWAVTTQLANDAVQIHGLGPVAAHVMCRGLSGGVLLSALLENDERFGIRWQYSGAVGNLFVDVGAEGDVRGTITNPVMAMDVRTEDDVYGNGGQVIVVKSNSGARLSAGTTDAAFCDVIGDLSFFFCVSDQVETAMRVVIQLSPEPGQPVILCHGIMLQAMPDCDLELFAQLADDLRSPRVNRFLDHPQLADNAIERLLQTLQGGDYDGSSLKLFGCPTPRYRCRCSRERTLNALRTIPQDELREMIENREETAVVCEFCRTRQVFDADDLRELLDPEKDS